MPRPASSKPSASAPRKSRRRLPATIATLLALGFFTTLAVAWAAALFIHVPGDIYAVKPGSPLKARVTQGWRMMTPEEERATGFNGRAHALTRYDRFASTYYSIDPLTAGGIGIREELERTRVTPEAVAGLFARSIVMPWPRGTRPWPANDAYIYFSFRGWPFRAFWLEYEQHYATNTTDIAETRIHGGIRVKFNDPTSVWYAPPPSPTALPYRPVWPGLILDTLFFASLWAALLYIPRAARRSLRRRRGLCPACAYDLRATPASSPCPECGQTRLPQTTAPQ
jgi:hypothetical protein